MHSHRSRAAAERPGRERGGGLLRTLALLLVLCVTESEKDVHVCVGGEERKNTFCRKKTKLHLIENRLFFLCKSQCQVLHEQHTHTPLCSDLVLLNEGSKHAVKSCLLLWRIQRLVSQMTMDAPKINTTFEGKFGTLYEKDKVCTFYVSECDPKLAQHQPTPE